MLTCMSVKNTEKHVFVVFSYREFGRMRILHSCGIRSARNGEHDRMLTIAPALHGCQCIRHAAILA
jgi:hypothetical protein